MMSDISPQEQEEKSKLFSELKREVRRRISDVPLARRPGATERVDWDQNTKSYSDRFNECYEYRLDSWKSSGLENKAEHLDFHQTPSAIGTSVYTAAVAAAKMLEHKFGSVGNDLRKTTLLELGSGTGLVGTLAAALGANVTLTDLEGPVLKNLERNIEQNSPTIRGSLRAIDFKWGSEVEELRSKLQISSDWPVDGILAVEVIYYSSCVDPLIDSLLDLTNGRQEPVTETWCKFPNQSVEELCNTLPVVESDLRHYWPRRVCHGSRSSPPILLGFDIRGREGVRLFLTKVQKWFNVRIIPTSQQHPEFICDHIRFLILTRKDPY
eukprot:gb/GECG01011302.1/.p1 GENE.gb/GECG01011302.1/~~gb/GECG01011302.1/.p1  ORF type:complete len:325 (+),score=21.21 gb/GECG01011302.1/:1-975(+)